MKINVNIEFDNAAEAAKFLVAGAVGGTMPTATFLSAPVANYVEPAPDPEPAPAPIEPAPVLVEIVAPVSEPAAVAVPPTAADTAASSEDEFAAPPAPKQPLQFTVPETINDAALRAGLNARMDTAKLVGDTERVRGEINKLIGTYGQAGKNQNSVPQQKRAEFLIAVAGIK